MIFEIYLKEGNNYKLCQISPPSGSDFSFFKSLRLTIEEQLNAIRNDILTFSGQDVSLINPKVDDWEEQQRINKLVEMRTTDMKVKEILNDILKGSEFIICEKCGGRMYKKPLNVAYTKIGNSFILKEATGNVEYTYDCDNCGIFMHEKVYLWIKQQRELREKLLAEGETWVPNDTGFWYGYKKDDNKCNHACERIVEEYTMTVDGMPRKVLKIQDKCIRCGEVIYSR